MCLGRQPDTDGSSGWTACGHCCPPTLSLASISPAGKVKHSTLKPRANGPGTSKASLPTRLTGAMCPLSRKDRPRQKPFAWCSAASLGLSWGRSFGKFPRLGEIISSKEMTPILHFPSTGGGDGSWVCRGTEVFLFAICTARAKYRMVIK